MNETIREGPSPQATRDVARSTLDAPVPECVLQRYAKAGAGSMRPSQAYELMDRTFGQAGWACEVEAATVISDEWETLANGTRMRYVTAQCVARVRAWTKDGIISRGDVGTCSFKGPEGGDRAAKTLESTLKGSATNAVKRAISRIGRRLGGDMSERKYNELIADARAHAQQQMKRHGAICQQLLDQIAAARNSNEAGRAEKAEKAEKAAQTAFGLLRRVAEAEPDLVHAGWVAEWRSQIERALEA